MTLRIISLGAGVQSTTVALLAARGDVAPMPDAAIFADTGWEPKAVYAHLAWLEKQLPFPVHRVSAGDIKRDLLARDSARSGRFITVPFFLKTVKPAGSRVPVLGAAGETVGFRTLARDEESYGLGRRQCTTHYKIEAITRKVRELLGKGPRDRLEPASAEMWIGISTDEIVRATPSRRRFEVKRFPLIELAMSRRDCMRWLGERQLPVPGKSACVGCPFHGNDYWRDLRDNRPEEWAEACAVDRSIRSPDDRPGVAKFRAQQFMHRSCVPLEEADLRTDADLGQADLFDQECAGMCGV